MKEVIRMATIATHNGSAVCREHNIRNIKVVSKEKHIDMTREHEVWHDTPIRKAYHDIFDEAVKKYNDKQERTDRKIKDYYNQINSNAKKHTAYEMIVGVYGDDVTDEQRKQILHQFVDGWKSRNPNLYMIGAYYHADEKGEPHVHIDYIPVANGYRNGMETQNGLVKALGAMGFEKNGKFTAQIKWEKRENECLDELCREIGIHVEHPKIANLKHLEKELYEKKMEIEQAEQQCQATNEQSRNLEADFKRKKQQLITMWNEIKDRKNRDEEALNQLKSVIENIEIDAKPTISKDYVKIRKEEFDLLMQIKDINVEAIRKVIDMPQDTLILNKKAQSKLENILQREAILQEKEQQYDDLIFDKAKELGTREYYELRSFASQYLSPEGKTILEEFDARWKDIQRNRDEEELEREL